VEDESYDAKSISINGGLPVIHVRPENHQNASFYPTLFS
jgi:hypothetical protein